MKIIRQQTVKRSLAVSAVLIALMFALSSFYYKSLVFEPAAVWHGANLGARSLFSGDEQARSQPNIDTKLIKRVNESIENGDFDYQTLSLSHFDGISTLETDVQKLIEQNQSRDADLQQNKNRLKQINEQLLNTQSIVDGLDTDFPTLLAYQQAELNLDQVSEQALSTDLDVPSESDAKALLSKSNRSKNNSSSKVPERVLNNVQNTTGISPEEINELMNR